MVTCTEVQLKHIEDNFDYSKCDKCTKNPKDYGHDDKDMCSLCHTNLIEGE